MRLGVISDTHGYLHPEVLDVFAAVDLVLHAGDIGPIEIVRDLETLAPVLAVHGNTDTWDVRRWCKRTVEVELDGFMLVLTHGDQLGKPTPGGLHAMFPAGEIIVFGHTHEPCLELVDKTVTVMNPGSAGAPRLGVPPSVGIMELEPGIPPRARIVSLGRG
ncbi:MAG TPA: metallophosphoesterase family protein [Gemmatimonadales bacterium]